MFQRQAFGSINPFQQWSGGINPLFQYGVGANPFLQFGGGISPFHQTAGLINPFQLLAGLPPFINPLGGVVSPFVNQMTGFAQQPGVTPGFGVVPPTGLGLNPLAFQYGAGVGPINPYVGQIGAIGPVNPAQVDPTVALMLAHQFNPVAQHLPIRPLAGPNPFEQIQGLAGNPLIGQPVDPYTALISAQILSQQAANPLHQIGRAHYGNPYAWGLGQFPVMTSLTPFGI